MAPLMFAYNVDMNPMRTSGVCTELNMWHSRHVSCPHVLCLHATYELAFWDVVSIACRALALHTELNAWCTVYF